MVRIGLKQHTDFRFYEEAEDENPEHVTSSCIAITELRAETSEMKKIYIL